MILFNPQMEDAFTTWLLFCTGNRYLFDAVGDLGLHRKEPSHSAGTFGIWDGQKVVFQSKEWKLLNQLSLLLR